MSSLIDLTFKYENKMPAFSKDEVSSLMQTHKIEEQGYVMHKLETYMHCGTHIDVPMHLINDNRYVSDFPLENFMGRGCIIDARGQKEIVYNPIYEQNISENDIVLVYTGHDKYWGNREYYDEYPIISKELAALFVEKKIKMVCLDTPSPDNYPFDIHKLLLSNDILIAECLTNLNKLIGENFEIIAFPLKIKAEASLVRVVAKIYP